MGLSTRGLTRHTLAGRRPQAKRGVVAALAVMLALTVAPAVATANLISVTTTAQKISATGGCSLQEAIYAANLDASKAPDPAKLGDPNAFITTGCAAGSGADTIVLPAMATFTMSGPVADVFNYVGPTATPMVTSNIVIEAAGAKLVHGGGPVPYRALAVGRADGGFGERGDLTLHEIHVKGFEVHGGDGGFGGGGGVGAGGAVYVSEGSLSVGWSTFEQNGALGGDGGSMPPAGATAGGGGGGLGGDGGGPGEFFANGGGGGGSRGDGGDGGQVDGGGGGGRVTDGGTPSPGKPCGGRGGEPGTLLADDGHTGECAGGGGGGGTAQPTAFSFSGDGGWGNYGGGGGGGGCCGGDGGRGGFGAGGGAFGVSAGGGSGGDGGFGGGGGAGGEKAFGTGGDPGQGGTFGGDGAPRNGGGGAGLGGAIFGDLATITVRNSTFFNNYANRGHSGGGDANDGRGAGGAIFLVAGSLFVNNSTFNNNQTGEFTAGIGGLGGGGIVVYKPTTGDAASLTLRNSILAGNGPHECYARNGASVSGVGNLITDNSANNRGDATCGGVVTSADPQLETLALNPPGRTPTMKIPLTSPAVDAADAATSEPDDQRGVARPQGAGFDIGAYEAGDSAPPVTTITLAPNAPNGSNGWYRTSVGVSVTAVDDSDPAPSTRCGLNLSNSPTSFDDLPDIACTPFNVVVDSSLHTVYAASRDASGNTETPLVTRTFKIDRTPPSLDPALSAPPVLGQTGVTALPNATDATSGVATAGCGAIDTSTAGDHTVTCTATDNAGNTSSITVHYVVEYRILGFFSPAPKSKWRVLTTVPVKVALADASGTRISDAEAAALATACRVRFSASGAQTLAPQCMKYASDEHQFVYAWMLARSGTGPATIAVTVSYPGTTSTTQKTEEITIIR